RHYRRLPVVGLIVAIVAVLVLAARPAGLPLALVEVALAAIGLGVGTVLPVTTVSIQNAVALHQLGTATASMNFFRSLGGAIMVAAFGAILLSRVGGQELGELRTAAASAGGAAEHLQDLAAAFGWVFVASAIGLAVALGFLLTMAERPLRGRIVKPAGRPALAPTPGTPETVPGPVDTPPAGSRHD
ncbi:MAG: hypothetical protein ACREH6_00685, partial [Geminicoccaceae bacterium]